MRAPPLPCALAIGGLDPGGGAGIAADLRSFHAAGAFGCAAIAVLTVQSTSGLRSVRVLRAPEVLAQAREVLHVQHVRAIKTGALGSAAVVRAVGSLLSKHADVPAVVDTVMLPTRGRSRLLESSALADLRRALVPRAWLVTANAPEAEVLTGTRVAKIEHARAAARAICEMGARAALVKGGHLAGKQAIDVLAVGGETYELALPRLRVAPTHGTGCVLASLVAGRIATRPRDSVLTTVRWAKRVHHAAMARAANVGGHLHVLVP